MFPTAKKSIKRRVIESIINGDLESFKKIPLNDQNINMILQPNWNNCSRPRKNPNAQYICPRGPTAIMLAVVCEESEIVKFLLETKNPDLSLCADGYTAFYLSVMTKDHSCFDLLLRTEYFQENLDQEFIIKNYRKEEYDYKTTILHTAIMQRNYYAVYYLLKCPLPEIIFKQSKCDTFEIVPNKKQNNENERSIEMLNQRSALGETPLKIATSMHDYKMVFLLYDIGDPDPFNPYDSDKEAENDPETAYGFLIKLKNDKKLTKNDELILKLFNGDKDEIKFESTITNLLIESGIVKSDIDYNYPIPLDFQSFPIGQESQYLCNYIIEMIRNDLKNSSSILEIRDQLADITNEIDVHFRNPKDIEEFQSDEEEQNDASYSNVITQEVKCQKCHRTFSDMSDLDKHSKKCLDDD